MTLVSKSVRKEQEAMMAADDDFEAAAMAFQMKQVRASSQQTHGTHPHTDITPTRYSSNALPFPVTHRRSVAEVFCTDVRRLCRPTTIDTSSRRNRKTRLLPRPSWCPGPGGGAADTTRGTAVGTGCGRRQPAGNSGTTAAYNRTCSRHTHTYVHIGMYRAPAVGAPSAWCSWYYYNTPYTVLPSAPPAAPTHPPPPRTLVHPPPSALCPPSSAWLTAERAPPLQHSRHSPLSLERASHGRRRQDVGTLVNRCVLALGVSCQSPAGMIP
jgi:hypothetical protein